VQEAVSFSSEDDQPEEATGLVLRSRPPSAQRHPSSSSRNWNEEQGGSRSSRNDEASSSYGKASGPPPTSEQPPSPKKSPKMTTPTRSPFPRLAVPRSAKVYYYPTTFKFLDTRYIKGLVSQHGHIQFFPSVQCFLCIVFNTASSGRPLRFHCIGEDAGIEPCRNVATSALAVRRSQTTRLDLIHTYEYTVCTVLYYCNG
jgi:hypothetical protein